MKCGVGSEASEAPPRLGIVYSSISSQSESQMHEIQGIDLRRMLLKVMTKIIRLCSACSLDSACPTRMPVCHHDMQICMSCRRGFDTHAEACNATVHRSGSPEFAPHFYLVDIAGDFDRVPWVQLIVVSRTLDDVRTALTRPLTPEYLLRLLPDIDVERATLHDQDRTPQPFTQRQPHLSDISIPHIDTQESPAKLSDSKTPSGAVQQSPKHQTSRTIYR